MTGAENYESMPFECFQSRGSPVDMSGNMPMIQISRYTYNFHRYLIETNSFYSSDLKLNESPELDYIVPFLTDEQAKNMWSNQWPWFSQTEISRDTEDFPDLPDVFDVDYTVVGGSVTQMTKRLSNSTVAGTSILLTLESIGQYRNADSLSQIRDRGYFASTFHEYYALYELAMARFHLMPLAAHTIPETSPTSQRRVKSIEAKVPAAALWSIVAANSLFAALALVVAILAWRASSDQVHQIQLRLGITGLTAALL
ncbi:hypothetical protein NX059_011556 [Plenodomus lindquistii]|nr:hypothetical protein NX059_011556 [Plenodomus lindquistii]